MSNEILRFLQEIDQELSRIAPQGERLDMYLLGRAALLLRFNLRLSTADVDIVQEQTVKEKSNLEAEICEIFSKESPKAEELGFYLDRVPQGLPPLPHWFRTRSTEIDGQWKSLRPMQLEIHDLAATKLKSFRAKDRQDLQFLCDKGQLDFEKLKESLEAAFIWSMEKDGDPDRETAFANLETVKAYIDGHIDAL